MEKYLNFLVVCLATLIVCVNCVPTSVLASSKAAVAAAESSKGNFLFIFIFERRSPVQIFLKPTHAVC